jgi:hypothetical protein
MSLTFLPPRPIITPASFVPTSERIEMVSSFVVSSSLVRDLVVSSVITSSSESSFSSHFFLLLLHCSLSSEGTK